MKAMRYIAAVMMVWLASVAMQATVQAPSYAFQSTSTMAGSGSALTSAAATGGAFANTVSSCAPMVRGVSGVRRVGEDEGWEEEEEPEVPANPYPIGNSLWVMLMMAGIYTAHRKTYQKKKKKQPTPIRCINTQAQPYKMSMSEKNQNNLDISQKSCNFAGAKNMCT